MAQRRILILSNSPLIGSGYGVQTKYMVKTLQKFGCAVAVLGIELPPIEQYKCRPVKFNPTTLLNFYKSQSVRLCDTRDEVDNYVIYLRGHFEGGWDVLRSCIDDFKADTCVVLLDMWSLPPEICYDLPDIQYHCWAPLDMDPPSKNNIVSLANLMQNRRVRLYTPSKTSAEAFAKTFTPVTYIYHCVDTKRFIPLPQKDCRQALNFPVDVFLSGMVAQNRGYPSRKGFDQNIIAWKLFYDSLPDDEKKNVMLYLHTNFNGSGGVNLHEVIDLVGIPKDRIVPYVTEKHSTHSTDEMVNIYNSLDVLQAATCGEGFGIPIVEAQACGTPAITSDFTSMPEVTFYGTVVPILGKQFMQHGSWWCIPNAVGICEALQKYYRMWKDNTLRNNVDRTRAIEKINTVMSVDAVMLQWAHTIDVITPLIENKQT